LQQTDTISFVTQTSSVVHSWYLTTSFNVLDITQNSLFWGWRHYKTCARTKTTKYLTSWVCWTKFEFAFQVFGRQIPMQPLPTGSTSICNRNTDLRLGMNAFKYLNPNADTVSRLDHDCFLTHPFQFIIQQPRNSTFRSQWPRGLRHGCTVTRLLGMWVRIWSGAWLTLGFCVLSRRGLCVGLITRPEKSYRVWCVQCVWMRSPVRGGHDPESGRSATGRKKTVTAYARTLSKSLFPLVYLQEELMQGHKLTVWIKHRTAL
jgi:hypothetical protein